MNYIRYNINTGEIVSFGYMNESLVQEEIDAGKPTLFAPASGDFENWKVDLDTKELKRVAPLVIPPEAFSDQN